MATAGTQLRAETRVFSGVGKVQVEAGYFGQDRKKDEARTRAERVALPNALIQAVRHVLGSRSLPEDHLNALVADLADHSATIVKNQQLTDDFIEDNVAQVKIAVKVDLGALTEYLTSKGISLVEEVASSFRVWVLSLPVEGVDPSSDRTKPIVLRDEVRDERQNVQASSYSELKVGSNSRSQSKSLQASQSSSDKGNVASQSSSSLDAFRNSSVSAKASADVEAKGRGGSFSASESGSIKSESSAKVKERSSSSGSASWDQQSSATVDARSASASAAYSKTANSGSNYSDTSTKYFRVTEYADPTKKSVGMNNEVRNMVEGKLKSAGLNIATMNLKTQEMEQNFTEDTFLEYVLSRAEESGASPEDYLAIVLNRLTPITTASDAQRRFGAVVTYRVIRVKDRTALIPAASISRESDLQSTDDGARNQATTLALFSMDSVLTGQIRQGLQDVKRQESQRAQKLAGKYFIQVEGVSPQDRSALAKLKQSLRQAGFTQFQSDTLNAGRTERITIELGGRSAEEVKDLLDMLPPGLQLLDKQEREARLKAN